MWDASVPRVLEEVSQRSRKEGGDVMYINNARGIHACCSEFINNSWAKMCSLLGMQSTGRPYHGVAGPGSGTLSLGQLESHNRKCRS